MSDIKQSPTVQRVMERFRAQCAEVDANCQQCGKSKKPHNATSFGGCYPVCYGHCACAAAAVPSPPAQEKFVSDVRETWRLLKNDPEGFRVRQFFTNCPGVDTYAAGHGWAATLRAIADGISVLSPPVQEPK